MLGCYPSGIQLTITAHLNKKIAIEPPRPRSMGSAYNDHSDCPLVLLRRVEFEPKTRGILQKTLF
jgi:hypothetical protein